MFLETQKCIWDKEYGYGSPNRIKRQHEPAITKKCLISYNSAQTVSHS